MAYRRSNSDTFKLRRLISSLKDSGSELGDHLESQAGQFFGDVHIVRANNPLRQEVKYDSDDEEDKNDFVNHTNYIRKQKSVQENARIDEINQRKSEECYNNEQEVNNKKREIVKDNVSTGLSNKIKEKEDDKLEKIRQNKEYIDNILNQDRLALEAENLRKKKKREEDLRKLDDKIKREQEDKQKKLLENKRKSSTINEVCADKKDNKVVQLRKEKVENNINIEIEQTKEKDKKAEKEKQLLIDEIARKKAEEEYAKLQKERENERKARAKREGERMKLLQKINEEREKKLKDAEEEKKLRDLENENFLKQIKEHIEEEEEESITSDEETGDVDISAEEERLRIAQEQIKELELSISSLDCKLERFDIEKMNVKTNNVKKRMSIVMGEDAVIEYFQNYQ